MNKHTAIIGTLLGALSGCGGQVGEETIVCQAVETTPVALTDLTPLGFRAADVIGAVQGQRTAPIRWADGQTGTLTLTLTTDGTATFLDREWTDDGSGAEIALTGCEDVVELPATLALTSDDGALDESGAQVLSAFSADGAQLLREVSDTFAADEFVPSGEWNSVSSWVELSITADELSGSINGQAAGEDGEVAFAQAFDIASVGTEPQ